MNKFSPSHKAISTDSFFRDCHIIQGKKKKLSKNINFFAFPSSKSISKLGQRKTSEKLDLPLSTFLFGIDQNLRKRPRLVSVTVFLQFISQLLGCHHLRSSVTSLSCVIYSMTILSFELFPLKLMLQLNRVGCWRRLFSGKLPVVQRHVLTGKRADLSSAGRRRTTPAEIALRRKHDRQTKDVKDVKADDSCTCPFGDTSSFSEKTMPSIPG